MTPTTQKREAAERRIVDAPEPGYFAIRMVKGGPLVAARIYASDHACPVTGVAGERPRRLLAEIAGRDADVDRVWLYGRPIPEAEYRYLMGVQTWAETNAPRDPAANPSDPIDLNRMESLF